LHRLFAAGGEGQGGSQRGEKDVLVSEARRWPPEERRRWLATDGSGEEGVARRKGGGGGRPRGDKRRGARLRDCSHLYEDG
jgi:hypothetical protein